MALSGDLFQTVVLPVTWALIHFLWQGSLVAGGLALVLSQLRNHPPSVRYRWSCGALILALILPPLTTLSYLEADAQRVTDNVAVRIPSMTETYSTDGASQAPVSEAVPVPGSDGDILTVEKLCPGIFGAWLVGVVLVSLIHLAGWQRVRSITRQRVKPVAQHWQRRVEKLSRRLGIPRAVVMLESALVEVPTVVGWLRPVILMPASTLSGLPPALIETFIAHELAHVLRRDYLVNLLQIAAETWLFYHPAVWWISRQIRTERENCCDDVAVAACGDRVIYAQALLCLEQSRGHLAPIALGASDGSLLRRIRRLVGGSTMSQRTNQSPRIALVICALLLIAGGAILALAAEWGLSGQLADTPSARNTFKVAQATANTPDEDFQDVSRQGPAEFHGDWDATIQDGRIELKLSTSGDWHSNFTMHAEQAEFTGFAFGEAVSFTLKREAGVFEFAGNLRGTARNGSGEGTFTLTGDPRFPTKLAKLGVTDLNEESIFVLAATDVGTAYVEGLRDRGYGEVPAELLVALAIHRVSLEYIDSLAALGYEHEPLEQLVALRIHQVTPDFIAEIDALGYHAEKTESLLAWKIHGVDGEFIEELKDLGYTELAAEELVALRIHQVTPDFLKQMKDKGFPELTTEQALAFRIHGVDLNLIEDFRELGYEDLSGEQLIAMRIHRVTPEFIEDLADLGYKNVPVDKLVAMRVHGITRDFIEKLREEGRTDLTIDDMVRLKIHGKSI